MGCTSSSNERRADSQQNGHDAHPQGNLPLSQTKPTWMSNRTVTQADILQQREEFWGTAPMLEGRPEVWEVLRAAAEADDHDFAQTILASAGVRLPDGTLRVAYDELGNIYRLPLYCISFPSNLTTNSTAPGPEPTSPQVPDPSAVPAPTPRETPSVVCPPRAGEPIALKIRVSNGRNVVLEDIGEQDVLLRIRLLLADQLEVDPTRLLLMFVGKRLDDQSKLEALGLRKNELLQAMLLP
eukprot:m.31645 g.31645  ORF g.31645 m.31645 type:complete len:240 (+) comp12089_c0_seq12:169-888(+)